MSVRVKDRIATIVFYAIAFFIIAVLAGLLGYIIISGISHLSWHFLTAEPQMTQKGGGIGPEIFNSFFMLFLTMLFTIPLGLGGGIFLSEYARPGKLTSFIRTVVEVLSALPSIVVGLFGLMVFVQTFKMGFSLLAGAIALMIFNLPLMVRITEQSLQSVAREQREASLGLGLSRWRTIVSVVLPAAIPGIVTGTILAAGRVFGEAAALMFTAGMSSPNLNFSDWNPLDAASPINPFRPAETLAVHIWKVNSEGLAPDADQVMAGASAFLVMAVLVFNMAARWVGNVMYRIMTGAK